MNEIRALEVFSERLADLIGESGETVLRLSSELKIKNQSMYAYLHKKVCPNIENAIRIADRFSCSLDYLFGFANDFEQKARPIEQNVPERIREAIDKSGFSRYRLSKITAIGEAILLQWYHGKKIPKLLGLIRLACALDCSLDYLVGRKI